MSTANLGAYSNSGWSLSQMPSSQGGRAAGAEPAIAVVSDWKGTGRQHQWRIIKDGGLIQIECASQGLRDRGWASIWGGEQQHTWRQLCTIAQDDVVQVFNKSVEETINALPSSQDKAWALEDIQDLVKEVTLLCRTPMGRDLKGEADEVNWEKSCRALLDTVKGHVESDGFRTSGGVAKDTYSLVLEQAMLHSNIVNRWKGKCLQANIEPKSQEARREFFDMIKEGIQDFLNHPEKLHNLATPAQINIVVDHLSAKERNPLWWLERHYDEVEQKQLMSSLTKMTPSDRQIAEQTWQSFSADVLRDVDSPHPDDRPRQAHVTKALCQEMLKDSEFRVYAAYGSKIKEGNAGSKTLLYESIEDFIDVVRHQQKDEALKDTYDYLKEVVLRKAGEEDDRKQPSLHQGAPASGKGAVSRLVPHDVALLKAGKDRLVDYFMGEGYTPLHGKTKEDSCYIVEELYATVCQTWTVPTGSDEGVKRKSFFDAMSQAAAQRFSQDAVMASHLQTAFGWVGRNYGNAQKLGINEASAASRRPVSFAPQMPAGRQNQAGRQDPRGRDLMGRDLKEADDGFSPRGNVRGVSPATSHLPAAEAQFLEASKNRLLDYIHGSVYRPKGAKKQDIAKLVEELYAIVCQAWRPQVREADGAKRQAFFKAMSEALPQQVADSVLSSHLQSTFNWVNRKYSDSTALGIDEAAAAGLRQAQSVAPPKLYVPFAPPGDPIYQTARYQNQQSRQYPQQAWPNEAQQVRSNQSYQAVSNQQPPVSNQPPPSLQASPEEIDAFYKQQVVNPVMETIRHRLIEFPGNPEVLALSQKILEDSEEEIGRVWLERFKADADPDPSLQEPSFIYQCAAQVIDQEVAKVQEELYGMITHEEAQAKQMTLLACNHLLDILKSLREA